MKKTLQNLFLLFLLFSYNAVSGQTNILFIGNSYTYTNDLPNMFSGLSANLGQNVVVSSKTNGGFTFQNHYNDPNTFTAIHQSVRDLVIIQGQSQEPSFPTSQVNTNTYPFAKRIADSVYASSPCTNLMYFSTWGRENGDPQWDSINTFDKMNSRLFNAYMRFADSSDAMLAPVSMAWKWVRDNYPTINLYVADGSHPSVEGTYLIACTIYASTFQETPVGATFYGGISQVNAEILQNAAAVSVLPNLELYHLHPVDIRTVSGFNWNLDANGLLTATSTSLNAEEEVWKVESEIYNGTSITHQFTNPGTYEVKMIALSDCNADTTVVYVSYNNVDLPENELSPIQIYPNPTNGIIHFINNSSAVVEVYSIRSEFIKPYQIADNSVDLTDLPKGIYLLKIENQIIRLVR